MSQDFILGGQASGSVAERLLMNGMNPNALRPYLDEKGRSCITTNQNGKATKLITNAPATLRKDDWLQLDTAILKAAKPRLKAWGDLRSAGLSYSIPNGMGKTVLEYEDQSDVTDAILSMDGLRKAESDRPEFSLKNLPLPIVHKDFNFSARQLAASRNGGSPLDTTTAELAGRRVAEQIEKLLLGVVPTYQFGGGYIYGYTNFDKRQTKNDLTAPDGSNAATTVSEVLEMKTMSQNKNHYGPWFCYCSTSWDQYMDDDYSSAKGDNTLRDRIGAIEGIDRPMTLDYLPANTLMLVQKSSDVVRAVMGMDITTVQWESHGGMQLNFKVMGIMVPQLRADFYDNCGIVHGSHA